MVNLLLLDNNDIQRILRMEFPSDTQLRRRNTDQCYFACNTWLLLLQDLGVPTELVVPVRDALLTMGMSQVITAAVDLAEDLLEGFSDVELFDERRWVYNHLQDRYVTRAFASIADYICESASDSCISCACILQALLFLERFTFINPGEDERAYRKFLNRNERCREIWYSWPYSGYTEADLPNYAYTWPGQKVLADVSAELSQIFTASDWSWSLLDGNFSSGSAIGAGRDISKKWELLASYNPFYKGCYECPLPVSDTNRYRMDSHPVLMAVPKSLSSRRVIAPEDVCSNFYGGAALAALRRMLRRNGTMFFINEEDQSVNRSLAGCKDGQWATIDMSGASDSISKALFYRCIPQSFVPFFTSFTSDWVDYTLDGQRRSRKLYTLFTSGNRLTWLVESCWFLALARVACCYAAQGRAYSVFAYGDDLVVPYWAYDTVCEMLELFGHTVNRRKSYGFGVFRESCGGWYYRGTDVTPIFWPRRSVGTDELLEVCCNLQHSLYEYPLCRAFSEELARSINPRITHSPEYDECDDLWSPYVFGVDVLGVHHWHKPGDTTKRHGAVAVAATYYEYLERGPLYPDGLSELLRVSSSRLEW